jgi:hypothetical protein
VLVGMLPGETKAVWEMVGERAAETHFSGPYQPFVQGGPRRVVDAFDALWRLQHDTGRWEIEVGDSSAEARLDAFPFASPEYGYLMTGYFRRILAMSGARAGVCSLVRCGAESGHWHLQWSA